MQIYWSYEQSIIANNVLSLDTDNMQFEENNFTCVGKNAFGADSRSVFVQIIGDTAAKLYLKLVEFESLFINRPTEVIS